MGSTALAGVNIDGIFRSVNNGSTWNAANTGLAAHQINVIESIGSTVYAGSEGVGMFMTSDNGGTWTDMNTTGFCGTVYTICKDGSKLYMGSSGLYLTTNNGGSWSTVYSQFIRSSAVSGSTMYVGTGNQGVFYSSNSGANWTQVNNGLGADLDIERMGIYGSTVFASNPYGASYYSTNNGSSWTKITAFPIGFKSIVTMGSTVVAGVPGYGVYFSSDAGVTWTRKVTGMSDMNVVALATNGSVILEVTSTYMSTNAFISTNNGTSWQAVGTGLPLTPLSWATISGNYAYIAANGSSVWRRALSEMVGIDEINTGNVFSLYPNPSHGSFTISCEKSFDHADVNIFSTVGENVYSLTLEGEQKTFNPNLPAGIYFIRVSTADNQFTQKIIIQ
jgi:photosystem II stability/assembly factor-like uncharacterized protein